MRGHELHDPLLPRTSAGSNIATDERVLEQTGIGATALSAIKLGQPCSRTVEGLCEADQIGDVAADHLVSMEVPIVISDARPLQMLPRVFLSEMPHASLVLRR
jgi:hypothetical protein